MARTKLTVHGGVGFANALRRSMLQHATSCAPDSVEIFKNDSFAVDEFLAHRIGLIPFREVDRSSPDLTGEVDVVGPATVTASDLTSARFQPIHGNIVVVTLGEKQCLHVKVRFRRDSGATHARFNPLSSMGMIKTGRDTHQITFGQHDPSVPPSFYVCEALDALQERVDRALRGLAHQDGSKRDISRC
tara:strand:+ start:1667 stop:2233 length:567 start_codon:yes stop_codon:yes gene_type:complete